MIEVSIRQTQTLTENNGRIPERVVARYLRTALDETPYDYEVSVGYDPVSTRSQQSGCGDNSGYWQWKKMVRTDTIDGVAKDSNVLLTNATGGGCGLVGGNVCSAPGGPIDKDIGYQRTGRGRLHGAIQDAMHEVGHNLGGSHDHQSDTPGAQHRGRAWNEYFTVFGIPIPFHYEWHRTPNVAGNGAENDCGEMVPEKNEPSVTVREHYYAECAIKKFEIE